jgi:hypothetical protein
LRYVPALTDPVSLYTLSHRNRFFLGYSLKSFWRNETVQRRVVGLGFSNSNLRRFYIILRYVDYIELLSHLLGVNDVIKLESGPLEKNPSHNGQVEDLCFMLEDLRPEVFFLSIVLMDVVIEVDGERI